MEDVNFITDVFLDEIDIAEAFIEETLEENDYRSRVDISVFFLMKDYDKMKNLEAENPSLFHSKKRVEKRVKLRNLEEELRLEINPLLKYILHRVDEFSKRYVEETKDILEEIQ